jgi:hypothetical protein
VPDQCNAARTNRMIVEIAIALFIGFVAAAVTAGLLTKSVTDEPAS